MNFVSTDPVYSDLFTPTVKAWFAQENSQSNIVQVATNILVTMNLVGIGLGVILISSHMNNFNTGRAVFRPITGNVLSIVLLMAWRKGEVKLALRDFITIVQERLTSVTAQLRIILVTCVADLSSLVLMNWRYRHREAGSNIFIFQLAPTFD